MTIHPTVPRRRELHTPHQICTFERVAHLNPICPNALRTCISPPKSKENVIFTIAQKENFRERVPEIGVQSAVPSVVQTNSSCHESSHVYNENGWKTRLEHALRHCITYAFTDDARRESALAQSREPLRKLPKVHSDAPRSETRAIGIQTTVEDGFSSIGSTVSIAKIDRGTETLDECTSLDSITRLTQYLSTSHYAECVALEEENNVKLRSVAAHYKREMESMQRSHEQEVTALRSELHRMTQQRELDLERLHDTIRATQKDMHVEWASVHREVRALSDLAQTADALNNTDHAMQDDNPTLNSQLFESHLSPNASMLWGAHSKMKDASTWTESTECCLHLEEIEALKTLMFERQQRWAEITQDMERERAHWKLVCRRHSSQTVDWPMLVESKGVNTPPFDDIGTASHIALVGDDHTDRDKSPLGSASPSMDTLMLRRCQRNETLLNSQIAELTATTKFLRQYIDHITSQHKEVFRTYEWTLGELMTCTGHLRALVRSREVRYEAVCEEVIRMRELLERCSSDLTAVRTDRSRMSPRRTCETEQAIHPEHLSAGDV